MLTDKRVIVSFKSNVTIAMSALLKICNISFTIINFNTKLCINVSRYHVKCFI